MPLVVEIPLWLPLILVLIPTVWFHREWLNRPLPKGICAKCGYDLTGNVSGRCPECGTVVGGGGRRRKRPPRRRVSRDVDRAAVFRAIYWLCGWFALTFLIEALFGPVRYAAWTWGDGVAIVAALFGAYHASRKNRVLTPFAIYGCAVGLLFVATHPPLNGVNWYPDGRPADPLTVTLSAILFTVAMAVSCRLVAMIPPSKYRPRRRKKKPRNSNRCRKCGYPLIGLPERQCPECGTPFE